MKRFLLTAAWIVFLAFSGITQNIPQTFQGKYHMLDSSELLAPKFSNKAFTITAPPVGTVRAIAEWEPAQAVIVSYPGSWGIPYTLIASMSQHTHVITLVESAGQQTSVTSSYNSNGVNISNCSFVITPLNSYWTRDYAPWFIMVNNSEIAIVDFPYNRPRPDDDNVPVVIGALLGEDVYGMNISHTGGNYMCDGMGVTATTDLVLDENPYTEAQIDTLMKQYMGATSNYVTTDPLGEYIKHIDCWSKFLDVDKILIGQVATTNTQYTDYEAMATYWSNQVSSYGNNYQVYRVYEPNGQPYTNSLILNKHVYVPTISGTGSSYNTPALNVYQNAMPGYTIVGITHNTWESTDALHCRTHEVADQDMLYIKHYPTLNAQNNLSQFPINANIYALSGNTIVTDSVWVRYSVNNGSWQQVQMTHPSGNLWTANIPGQTPGDSIKYYIHAADATPKSVTHPLIGSPDPHKFYITGSVAVAENTTKPNLVFPNPAVTDLMIQVRDVSIESIETELISAVGTTVVKFTTENPSSQLVRIDVRQLTPGTYFLKTTANGASEMKKVVVMH